MPGLYDLMDTKAQKEYKRRDKIGKRSQIHGYVIFVITVE